MAHFNSKHGRILNMRKWSIE